MNRGTPRIPQTGIRQDWPPLQWRHHRFGLPPERWAALSGQVFWITGAGTGYGRAMALCLAAAGGKVAISGRRAEKLQETLSLLQDFAPGASAIAVPGDVTDPAAMTAVVGQIEQCLGMPGGLICAAALPQADKGGLTAIAPDDLRRLLDTNVLGQLFPARALLARAAPAPVALARPDPTDRLRVLFLTSQAGWAATPGFGPYNLSKAALNSLAMSLAAEIAAARPGADIQINTLSPGEAGTEMNAQSTASPFAIASLVLALISHPPGGPTGRFFHRDGQHWGFGYQDPWEAPLL
ncbi:MAG: SDR family NAD(P)-dependent oxidoreductase [Azospirillum sp.]|nr:SDR family NAD(P)-dependent oxidoreductase [Azospirillum sp.]